MVFLKIRYRRRAAVALAEMIWGVSFFLHFVREMLQVPFFSGMTGAGHWDVVWLCTRATFGDANIAFGAYTLTALVSREWLWVANCWNRIKLSTYFAVGLVVTIVFEYWATGAGERWVYSELMPVLSWTGMGILLLIQWVILPLMSLYVFRWMFLGWLGLRSQEKNNAGDSCGLLPLESQKLGW